MNKAGFYFGLLCLYLGQFLVLYSHSPETDILKVALDTCFLLCTCLALAFLGWLGSRWKAGHWSVDALNASGKRRRFLFFGALFISCIFTWGDYLDITEHLFW